MDRNCGNIRYTLFDIVGIKNIGDFCSCSKNSYLIVGVTMFLHGRIGAMATGKPTRLLNPINWP